MCPCSPELPCVDRIINDVPVTVVRALNRRMEEARGYQQEGLLNRRVSKFFELREARYVRPYRNTPCYQSSDIGGSALLRSLPAFGRLWYPYNAAVWIWAHHAGTGPEEGSVVGLIVLFK